ncbi:MAG: asparagine--tRNA ligase [Nitrospinota bacterium]
MNRTLLRDIFSTKKPGEKGTVCGWVRSKRVSKSVAFISLNDGSTQNLLQLVVPGDVPAFQKLTGCNTGASVKAEGTFKESPGQEQSIEMEVTQIEVLGDADPEKYPLQKKGHTLEFLREIGHLRPRTNTYGAVFRIRSILSAGIHSFFRNLGFFWVHTPVITSSDCEGAGEMFSVTTLDLQSVPKTENGNTDFSKDFFKKPAFLTVSGQLEAEFMALALGNVYTFGPTFRAENSNTSRHLSEFWMIEPEMAFADLKDTMELAENFIRYLFKYILDHGEGELSFLEKQYKNISIKEIEQLSEKAFSHISYSDAVTELKKAQTVFEFPVSWGLDLQSEHEKYLTDIVFKGPVIVTDYPKEIKAFYMRMNDDKKTVAAMDLLLPRVGEIIGGSQREERLSFLENRAEAAGIKKEHIQWYLDLRRFGSAPHSGFGLGLERLVQYVSGMPNIRDVSPCPRCPETMKF